MTAVKITKNKEYVKMMGMNYFELAKYLQEKYGIPQGSYWLTESCRSKNQKIMRGMEGLYCHHIKENLGNDLSNRDLAVKFPFEWQHGENLVYCNYLEHSILHLKISEWIIENHPTEYSPTYGLGYFGNIAAFTRDMLHNRMFEPGFYKIVSDQMKEFHKEIYEIYELADENAVKLKTFPCTPLLDVYNLKSYKEYCKEAHPDGHWFL